MRSRGLCRARPFLTRGYRCRRLATDHNVPLMTNVNCVKLFVEALRRWRHRETNNDMSVDCISSTTILKLPGLIDWYVKSCV